MSRYTKTDVVTGDSVKSDVNVQLGLIEAAIADTVSRVGDLPNTMSADLDMNSNQILNLPDAVTSGEPITLRQGLSTLDWSLSTSDAKFYDTEALATADTSLVAGDEVILKDHLSSIFDVVAGTSSANGEDIIAHDTLSLSLVLRKDSKFATHKNITLYVDKALGSDVEGAGWSSGAGATATIQYAVDTFPNLVQHDVVINIANGTYNEQGGTDEWGRPVVVDMSQKTIAPLRDSTIALNTKAAKITLRGSSESLTILDGTAIGARNCVWAHGTKDLELETMRLTGATTGLLSHEGGSVTCYDVTADGCNTGFLAESFSKIEMIRGTSTNNTFGIGAEKGSRIQWNDGTLTANVTTECSVKTGSSVYLLRVDGAASSGRNYIDAEGASSLLWEECDVSGGNNFIIGTCTEMRIKNGTRIRGFTSAACAMSYGLFVSDRNGTVNHVHNNGFIANISAGAPQIDLTNCDSLNASAVDEPNTNGARLRGSEAASAIIDPLCSVNNEVIETDPTSGQVFRASGGVPPTDTAVFYEKNVICLNDSTALYAPTHWTANASAYGGSVVWNPQGGGRATTAELADIGHAVNTSNKSITRILMNANTNLMVRARGTAAADPWVDAQGVVVHTPV
jgi:hypothetical protein